LSRARGLRSLVVTPLRDKIENGLNEARILVLGAQVLIGFDLRAPLEPGFEQLPPSVRALKLASLATLIVAFGLLVAPATYHWIVVSRKTTGDVRLSLILALSLLGFLTALWFGVTLWRRHHDSPHGIRARTASQH